MSLMQIVLPSNLYCTSPLINHIRDDLQAESHRVLRTLERETDPKKQAELSLQLGYLIESIRELSTFVEKYDITGCRLPAAEKVDPDRGIRITIPFLNELPQTGTATPAPADAAGSQSV